MASESLLTALRLSFSSGSRYCRVVQAKPKSPAPAHKGAESGPICTPASLQSTENVRTARAQAPEVKSDSRYVRFVIAKHSPERVSATGLRIEAREKNRCNGSDAAERSFSLVRFVEEIPRKVGLFRLFQEKRSRVSLQWKLRGGGRGNRTPGSVSRSAVFKAPFFNRSHNPPHEESVY